MGSRLRFNSGPRHSHIDELLLVTLLSDGISANLVAKYIVRFLDGDDQSLQKCSCFGASLALLSYKQQKVRA